MEPVSSSGGVPILPSGPSFMDAVDLGKFAFKGIPDELVSWVGSIIFKGAK